MASFGERLRQEREIRRIELEEISRSTRIGRSYLEAIEGDDWEALPGDVYVRGYLRSYAEYVGLDPDRVVNDYLYHRRGGPGDAADRQSGRGPVSRSVVWALILTALAVVAVLLWWWSGA